MIAAPHHDQARASAVDRLCELTSIGAGHAAGALATLLARPFEMRVPVARVVEARHVEQERAGAGVLFDVSGGLGGTLALLFSAASRDALLAALLGKNAGVAEQAESTLREVGNIVASHALSAIGAVLGVSVLPSTPRLELREAPRALAHRVAARTGERPALRIEVELCDRVGEVQASLVYVPAAIA